MQAGALKDRVHEPKETEKGVEHRQGNGSPASPSVGRKTGREKRMPKAAEDGMTVDRIAKILKVNAQGGQERLAGSVSTAR